MDSSTSAGAGVGIGIIFAILFYAAIFGFAGWMYWKIALKAGYPGLYGLSVFVPILNIVALIIFVFKPWPIEEELARLRAGAGGYGGGYPPVGGGYPGGPQGVQYQQPVPRMAPPAQSYGAPAFEDDYAEEPAPQRPAPQRPQYPGAGPAPQPPAGYRQPPPYGSGGGGLPTRPGR